MVSILLNPIAGAVADQANRKKILLVSYMVSAIICTVISLMGNDRLLLYGIIVANVILSVTYSFSSTAFKSMVPQVMDSEKVLAFNSTVETLLQIFSVVSPVMTYFIYSHFGIRMALLINGLSFIGSFLAILTIDVPEDTIKEEVVSDRGNPFVELFSDIKAGLTYIFANKSLLELLLLSAFVNFFLSFYNFLMPFSNTIFGNEEMYSRLLFSGALGSILGAFCSKYVPNSRTYLLLALGLCGFGILCIGLTSFSSILLLVSYLGNLLFTLFLSIYNIHFISRIQQKVADAFLGRVFSAVFTIAICFMPLGTALITLFPGALNRASFLVVGLAIMLLSFSFLFLKKKKREEQ